MNSRREGATPGRLYWIGGSKGGVGQSMMTFASIDYLLSEGRKVLLVECDKANPDVFRAHKDLVHTELADLDEGDGWIHLVNVCDAHRDSTVVVNTAARNDVAVTRYGQTLDGSLDALDAKLSPSGSSTGRATASNFSKSLWRRYRGRTSTSCATGISVKSTSLSSTTRRSYERRSKVEAACR
jgi:hypothetical protein